jgi:hypothetical protein
MVVPQEFEHLARGFYQGSGHEVSTLQEWIEEALKRLNAKQKVVVKGFLTELLSGNHDEAELQHVWNSTSADYFVSGDRGLRTFLTMIRDAIE